MNAERIFVPTVFATGASSEKSITTTPWVGCTWTKKRTLLKQAGTQQTMLRPLETQNPRKRNSGESCCSDTLLLGDICQEPVCD